MAIPTDLRTAIPEIARAEGARRKRLVRRLPTDLRTSVTALARIEEESQRARERVAKRRVAPAVTISREEAAEQAGEVELREARQRRERREERLQKQEQADILARESAAGRERQTLVEGFKKRGLSQAEAEGAVSTLELRERAVKRVETPEKEKGRPSARVFSDAFVGLIPIYGTVHSAKQLQRDWDTLSLWKKISGVGLTTLSAGGDVLIIAGGAGLVLKAAKGGKVVQTLAMPAKEATKIMDVAADAGKSVKAARITPDVPKGQIDDFITHLGDNPTQLTKLKRLEIVAGADAKGVKELARIDNAIAEISKTLPPSAVKRLEKITDGVLVIERELTQAELKALVTAARKQGIKRLKIRVETRPLPTAKDAQDMTAVLKAAGKEDATSKDVLKFLKEEIKVRNKAVLKTQKQLRQELRGANIRMQEELVQTQKTKSFKRPRRMENEIEIIPERKTPSIDRGPVPTKVKEPPGTIRTTIRTPSGVKVPMVVAPGYISLDVTDVPAPDLPVPITTPFIPTKEKPEVPVTPEVTPPPAPEVTPTPEELPEKVPTKEPAKKPEKEPPTVPVPTPVPTKEPTKVPTEVPTKEPEEPPVRKPEKPPVKEPEKPPVKIPEKEPTKIPTGKPAPTVGKAPTPKPSEKPIPVPTPKPQPTPAKLRRPTIPIRPPTRKPPTRAAPIPFRLPTGRLPSGVFPLVVRFPMGVVDHVVNLRTGSRQFIARATPSKKAPEEGLRVIKTTKTRPSKKRLPQGLVSIELTPFKLSFKKRKRSRNGGTAFKDRTFRNRRL